MRGASGGLVVSVAAAVVAVLAPSAGSLAGRDPAHAASSAARIEDAKGNEIGDLTKCRSTAPQPNARRSFASSLGSGLAALRLANTHLSREPLSFGSVWPLQLPAVGAERASAASPPSVRDSPMRRR